MYRKKQRKVLATHESSVSIIVDEKLKKFFEIMEDDKTYIWNSVQLFNLYHAFFVCYENANLVYDVIRMRQLSKQTSHELSPNDNS